MELKQYLKMTQQLVMTPQLQQAIKLLQLSRVELTDTISKELLENPILEMQEGAGRDGAEGTDASDANDPSGPPVVADRGGVDGPDGFDRELGPNREEREEFPDRGDHDLTVTGDGDGRLDWESFVENYNSYSYSPGAGGVRYTDDNLPTLEQTLATRENLFDHLEWQLGLTQFTPEEQAVALRIIGNINDDGYLSPEILPQLAEESGLELDEIEAVLEVIQAFDPVGVGARDLRECLLIQAKHFYPRDDLVHDIIDRHLDNLEKRNVQAVLKDLDIDLADLAGAAEIIAHLEPRPGRSHGAETTHYITPDVYVTKIGEDFLVTLNEDGLPKLKISSFYQNHIKGRKATGQEKSFIQDKFKSAVWLIRSIHQRQNTIRRVTESIVKFQREFLDRGVEFLRPLILRDVADDVGMHESTISRVTTNKYVHTPQGIFELKYFFNSRITSSRGEDVASESVKQRIKQLIGQENPKRPLSDQKLCDLLSEEGTEIARRTVAKYREMMGIAPSSKRKKLF